MFVSPTTWWDGLARHGRKAAPSGQGLLLRLVPLSPGVPVNGRNIAHLEEQTRTERGCQAELWSLKLRRTFRIVLLSFSLSCFQTQTHWPFSTFVSLGPRGGLLPRWNHILAPRGGTYGGTGVAIPNIREPFKCRVFFPRKSYNQTKFEEVCAP